MKKIIVSALLVSAFSTYTLDTTEAATTAKKVPAIEAKTKKGYIKGKRCSISIPKPILPAEHT